VRLADIAARIGGELCGDGELDIAGVAVPEAARPTDIVFVETHAYLEPAQKSKAGAFLIDSKLTMDDRRSAIRTASPRFAFLRLLELFEPPTARECGIHPTAIIGKDCRIGERVTVMAYSVLGDQVTLEDDVVIWPHCYVGAGARIGAASCLHPRAVVMSGCVTGRRCILQSGSVIGSTGFGYHDEGPQRYRIPHLGVVILEDDVEVGANSAIDRAVIGATRVGRNTKIDNLVQLGHNAQIGAGCYIVAQVGVGGSSRIGNYVVLGGQCGISDHIKVGDGAMVAGKSAVRESLQPGEIVGNPPAFPIRVTNELVRLLPQLPALFDKVERLATGPNAPAPPADDASWQERVVPILARTLRVKPELIGPDMDLKAEFNADSLTVLTVVTEIESQFGISIPDEDVPALRTLAAVVTYLEKNFPAPPLDR
jgi:UDP-3-O-[3-hydroxymyristoyl] glucosamine N-acyltransferase